MSTLNRAAPSRRHVLRLGASLAAGAALWPLLPGRAAQAEANANRRLSLGPARVPLVGGDGPMTDVWGFDGMVPGPVLRTKQGEPFEVAVENRLREETTVHWHGIRLPNAMDGVPGLTQPPIQPGETFTYRFTPPDAGTFWYHPHADSLVQMGRGLAGALIVEERQPPKVDRELLWVVQDWRLDDDGQIAPGFGNRMEAAMAGRIGNTVTINGRVPDAIKARAGERLRLRIINAATARILALDFGAHRPLVVALDGQPCGPHSPARGRLLLGPAMRADVILDMTGEPGSRHQVIDDFYGDQLAYALAEFAYEATPLRAHPLDAPVEVPANPLPEPDLASAEQHEIALQGGMMSGPGVMAMGGVSWSMNGVSETGDGAADMPPLLTLRRGSTCMLELKNETAWWHPMHLHGHSFRVLSKSAAAADGAVWGDTVLVPPRERVAVAFVADNPGDWMLHCHVMDHQVAGLMTVLRVA